MLTSLGVQVIKQYPGQEQVDLKVVVQIPGSWFGGTASGALSASERRELYEAQAVEYAAVHEFPGATVKSKKVREAGIRFICMSDAADEPTHEGFWIELSKWNRYRHYTYKDRPADELPFIKELPAASTAAPQASAATTETKPKIKDYFECVEVGEHLQSNGVKVPCSFFKCLQSNCKNRATIKEIKKNTGLLYRHLEKCNPQLWRELRLDSKHSKLRQGEEGEDIEVRRKKSKSISIFLQPLPLPC